MPRYINTEKLLAEFDKCLWGKEWDKALAMVCVANTPTADVVEIKKEGEWEMFDLISSAYYGKGMYFKQDGGIVYSRYSCKYMNVDEAIREFVSLIDDSDLPNACATRHKGSLRPAYRLKRGYGDEREKNSGHDMR